MSDDPFARARRHLAFALDYPTLEEARRGAAQVAASVGVLKVGLELFIREGPRAVALGGELGCEVFLDLKLHDIPETVERATASAARLGVRYLTVHASGGREMIEAAARGAARTEGSGLVVLAVSVLTSLDANDLDSMGIGGGVEAHVERLARLAAAAGAGGLVCSPLEVASLRGTLGSEPILVTPGIRPAPAGEKPADDQKRTATAHRAITDGASLLVVGRPIRDAADPAAAARAICTDIARALSTG